LKLAGLGVLVIGLGASGRAAALVCAEGGARVTATDLRAGAEIADVVAELDDRGVRTVLGRHDAADFAAAELIVISPGVPLDLPELESKRDAVELIGELELASRLLDPAVPLAAITGSNGKSTVTEWLGEMLRGAGCEAFVGGNLGRPLCDLVLEGGRPDWAVVEVSSYQLDTASRFAPQVAALLNLSPDHLDRYPSLDAYYASKLSIFDRLVPEAPGLIGPDAEVEERTRRLGDRRHAVSLEGEVRRGVFLASPARAVWRDGAGHVEDYDLGALRVAGRHNRINALCSLGLARLCGAAPEGVRRGLAGFTGLSHRMQLVREREGVRFFDDSKGTNAGAVAAGLMGFDGERVLLIAGGKDKGTGYDELAAVVRGRVRVLLLIGEAAGALEAALAAFVPEVVRCETLERAVVEAGRLARPGDAVLLSPACASFDQFEDYRARGRAFVAAVEGLDS